MSVKSKNPVLKVVKKKGAWLAISCDCRRLPVLPGKVVLIYLQLLFSLALIRNMSLLKKLEKGQEKRPGLSFFMLTSVMATEKGLHRHGR